MDKKYDEIINKYHDMGVELYLENDRLRYRSISRELDEETLAFLKANKDSIISYLKEAKKDMIKKDAHSSFPLTPVQSSYLFGRSDLYSYGNVSCHIYQEFIYDKLEPDRLEYALNQLISRHDMLRVVVYEEGYQKILKDPGSYRLITGLRKQIRQELENKIYALGTWPMFDIGLSQEDNKSILHFSMDFMVSDWSGIWQLLKELESIYFGEDIILKRVDNTSFRDYVLRQENKKKSIEYKQAKEYWTRKLNKLNRIPELPLKLKDNNSQVTFKRLTFNLDIENWNTFKNLARKNRVTTTSVIMAVYGEVLKKWSTQKDFSVNLTLFNRTDEDMDLNEVIGDFTNTSLVTIEGFQSSIAVSARKINEEIFNCIDNSLYSGVEVLRDIATSLGEKEFLAPYVFTSSIGLLDDEIIGKYVCGISQTPQVFIDCQAMDTKEGLQINWDVRNGAFPDGMVEDMFSSFTYAIKLLTSTEEAWSRPLQVSLPDWQCDVISEYSSIINQAEANDIIFYFLKQVEDKPDKVALVGPKTNLSYKELFKKASQLALSLNKFGIRPSDRVIVTLEHNPDQVISLIAILLLGASFIPIEQSVCEDELIKILNLSKSKLILTNKEKCYDLPFLSLESIWSNLEEDSNFSPEQIDPYQEVYATFEKDSTGCVKEASYSHIDIWNVINNTNNRFEISERDTVLRVSNLALDISIYDVFGLLSVGGMIVYPSYEKDLCLENCIDAINEYQVSIWNSTPEMVKRLQRKIIFNKLQVDSIRLILLSKNSISINLLNSLNETFLSSKVVHFYSFEEIPIWSIFHEVDETSGKDYAITYRKLIDCKGMHILDKNLEVSPILSIGDLYIENQELRSEINETSKKLTKTGNKGRIFPDGKLEVINYYDSKHFSNRLWLIMNEVKNAIGELIEIKDLIIKVEKIENKTYLDVVVESGDNLDESLNLESNFFKDFLEMENEFISSKDLEEYRNLSNKKNKICLNFMLNTLIELKALSKNETGLYQYNKEASSIQRKFYKTIDFWMMILLERGLLKLERDMYLVSKIESKETLIENWNKCVFDWQEKFGDINIMHYVYENLLNLSGILEGKTDPIDLLYPDTSNKYVDALYRNSLFSKLINEYYALFIENYLREEKNKKIRILEIGAGTGATTERILDKIKGLEYEYYYTDSEKYFLAEGKKRFINDDRIKFVQFNVNEDPSIFGVDDNYFDIVIAAYVLDNAIDIEKSLSYIRRVLVPGGYLLFSEPYRSEPWLLVSQVLMMDETVDKIREDKIFLNKQDWKDILEKTDLSDDSSYEVFPKSDTLLETLDATFQVKKMKRDRVRLDRDELTKKIASYGKGNIELNRVSIVDKFPIDSLYRLDYKKIYDRLDFSNSDKAIKMTQRVVVGEFEKDVLYICREALGNEKLEFDSNLYDYGADSLIMAKIATELRKIIKDSITFEELLREIIREPIPLSISEFIQSVEITENNYEQNERSSLIYTKIFESRGGENNSKLRVLVHGAFGSWHNFENLAYELAAQGLGDVLIIGVADTEAFLQIDSKVLVDDLANLYYKEITEFDFENIELIGYSFTGVVTLELSRRLLESGRNIDKISIIEGGTVPSYDIDDLILEFVFLGAYGIGGFDLGFDTDDIFDYKSEKLSNPEDILSLEKLINVIEGDKNRELLLELSHKEREDRFEMYCLLLTKKSSSVTNPRSLMELYDIFKHSVEAQKYMPELIFVDLDYYIAKDNKGLYRHIVKLSDQWKEVVIGDMKKIEINGDHYTCLQDKENAINLAKCLENR